jgi:Icc-related predicted phosphoesterase
MKFIFSSNILESTAYLNFLEEALIHYPETNFVITGDILNLFPETREHLPDSIFYELYGKSVINELDKLKTSMFKINRISPFAKSLHEMLSPLGEYHQKTQAMAVRRYERVFSHMEAMLGQNKMYYIAGDMDYPGLMECVTRRSTCFKSIDSKVVTLDGTKIAGIGGTPENLRPIPGIVDLAPNVMAPAELNRKLKTIWGVDVVVTHVCPDECSELRDFIKKSNVKLVVCKAPFIKKNQDNYRGKLEISTIKNTYIIKVRPFETQKHQAMVVDITQGNFDLKAVDIFEWSVSAAAETAGAG